MDKCTVSMLMTCTSLSNALLTSELYENSAATFSSALPAHGDTACASV